MLRKVFILFNVVALTLLPMQAGWAQSICKEAAKGRCCKDVDSGKSGTGPCPNAGMCARSQCSITISAYGFCKNPCRTYINVAYTGQTSARLIIKNQCLQSNPECIPDFCIGLACTGTAWYGSGVVWNQCTSICTLIEMRIVLNYTCDYTPGKSCSPGTVLFTTYANCESCDSPPNCVGP